MTLNHKIARSKVQRPSTIGAIPSQNSNEPIVSIKPNSKLAIVPIWEDPVDEIEGPLYQKYIQTHPEYSQLYLRQTVVRMLYDASGYLPTRYKLIVRAGHRPVEVQRQLLDGVKNSYMSENPEATNEQALAFARTYVSDPSIKLPPHCCGAAVDVDMLDVKSGKLVDFGCKINTDEPISFLHSNQISSQQKANRLVLLTAMLKAGFSSLPTEWWHYSYGDQTWAWFYQKPEAIYSINEPNL